LQPPRWTGGVPWLQVDVGSRDAVTAAVAEAEADAVIHLAAILGTAETFDHPWKTVEANVGGTINVLEACRARPGTHYFGVETGTPWLSPYAISKRAATDFARAYHRGFGVPVTILKGFNVYGPRQMGTEAVTKIVPRFGLNALRGEPLPVYGDGTQTIDLVHVEDCATSFALAVERAPGRAEVIEVGTGVPITVLEVARRILDLVGGGEMEFLPMRIGEGPEYPVADTRMAREVLGHVPPATPERLAETVLWYREHMLEGQDLIHRPG
ncbi:MAG: NAD-dependent epimerase/dehydratase family protein, partial [Actinomycetota bacterium]